MSGSYLAQQRRQTARVSHGARPAPSITAIIRPPRPASPSRASAGGKGCDDHVHPQIARDRGQRPIFAQHQPKLPVRFGGPDAGQQLAQTGFGATQLSARIQIDNLARNRLGLSGRMQNVRQQREQMPGELARSWPAPYPADVPRKGVISRTRLTSDRRYRIRSGNRRSLA